MTALEGELAVIGGLIGVCAAAYGYARFEAWLEVRRQVGRWRRQVRSLHSGHVDEWERTARRNGGGPEPPR